MNPLRAARLGEEATETKPRPSWRNPQGTALLRWARGLTNLLPSLHFLLWPLLLSAAPCLGKMRVSYARWRGIWLPGGGGACGPGTAAGPINVVSDVDTDDNSEYSGSEPSGEFAVGSARGSPGRGQAGVARFVGRERKRWSSRAAVGPVRGGPAAGLKAGLVGSVHRTYTGSRRAKVVLAGTQAVRPRAPARRQAGRPRLAQQIGMPQPKRTKLGQGGHVRAPEAQGPVEGALVAAAERLKAKAWGRAGPVASPPPPSVRVPTRVRGCRDSPPSSWSSCRHSPPIFTG